MINIIYDNGVFFDLKLVSINIEDGIVDFYFGSDYTAATVSFEIKLKPFIDKEKLIRSLIKNLKLQENESYSCGQLQERTYEIVRSLGYCDEQPHPVAKLVVMNATDD